MAPPPRIDPHRGELFCWSGRSLLTADPRGRLDGQGVRGFWSDNTRVASRITLKAGHQAIEPDHCATVGSTGLLGYGQIETEGDGREPKIHVRVARHLDQGLRTEWRFESAHLDTVHLSLELEIDADFADIEEARLGHRRQTAEVRRHWDAARRELVLQYLHPDLDWSVAFAPKGWKPRYEEGKLRADLTLHPHQPVAWALEAEPIKSGERRACTTTSFATRTDGFGRRVDEVREKAPRLTTSNQAVQRAWDAAVEDLPGLGLGFEGGPLAPFAGLPMYHQFFGRDSLTTAGQAAFAFPEMLRDALAVNAFLQGTRYDDWRDEEPGKLIHQARLAPLAELGLTPLDRYYGDFSAPQDFVVMVATYLAWTGDRETTRQFMPAVEAIIDWGERVASADPDGFLYYDTRSPDGVKNQGWKDSSNAIVYGDGSIVPNPIAASDVQAYWYGALRAAAFCWMLLGRPRKALAYRSRAAAFRVRFNEKFCTPDRSFYATALDADRQPVGSVGSNAGHMLAMGIAPEAVGRRVAARLMEPDLFSGWGVRTLSTHHPAYDPLSYHLGTVWPIENSTFVWGFSRYGCVREMWDLAAAFFDSTELFERGRLPEVLGGYPRDVDHPHPGLWPRSNSPQAWSASSVLMVVEALLGMRPMAPARTLLVDPRLPEWLPDLRIDGLRVGGSVVSLGARRTRRGATRWWASTTSGRRVLVIRQPQPYGSNSGIGSKAGAALRSMVAPLRSVPPPP